MRIAMVAYDGFTDVDLFLPWDLFYRVKAPDYAAFDGEWDVRICADTPTITGSLNRVSTRFTMPTDSSWAIFGASPSWPSTVMPVTPAWMKKSVMRSMDDSSMRPSGWKGVGAMT